MSSTPPGLDDQARTRNTLRITGLALLVVALYLFGSGVADFLSANAATSTGGGHGPSKFGMLFLGLLLFAPAGWCLQAGFMGSSGRGVAGETLPAVRDAASYLREAGAVPGQTDSTGPTGPTAGATDPPPTMSAAVSPSLLHAATQPAPGPPTGLACAGCDARSHEGARFCERCGAPLAG